MMINKKSLSESIRNDIEKLKSLTEARFDIGKPELPEGTEFLGNIWIDISLESEQDLSDMRELEKWLNNVMKMFGYQQIGGGVGMVGGDLQYEGKPNTDVIKTIQQVQEIASEANKIIEEYADSNEMSFEVSITPTISMANETKRWYGIFADQDEMAQLLSHQISPAELLLKKQYDGEFEETNTDAESKPSVDDLIDVLRQVAGANCPNLKHIGYNGENISDIDFNTKTGTYANWWLMIYFEGQQPYVAVRPDWWEDVTDYDLGATRIRNLIAKQQDEIVSGIVGGQVGIPSQAISINNTNRSTSDEVPFLKITSIAPNSFLYYLQQLIPHLENMNEDQVQKLLDSIK